MLKRTGGACMHGGASQCLPYLLLPSPPGTPRRALLCSRCCERGCGSRPPMACSLPAGPGAPPLCLRLAASSSARLNHEAEPSLQGCSRADSLMFWGACSGMDRPWSRKPALLPDKLATSRAPSFSLSISRTNTATSTCRSPLKRGLRLAILLRPGRGARWRSRRERADGESSFICPAQRH
jgi:hypothetical protein